MKYDDKMEEVAITTVIKNFTGKDEGSNFRFRHTSAPDVSTPQFPHHAFPH